MQYEARSKVCCAPPSTSYLDCWFINNIVFTLGWLFGVPFLPDFSIVDSRRGEWMKCHSAHSDIV